MWFHNIAQENIARTGKEYVYPQTNDQPELCKRMQEKRLHKIMGQHFSCASDANISFVEYAAGLHLVAVTNHCAS